MIDIHAIEYFRAREQQERERAEISAHRGVARMHIELAERYAELVICAILAPHADRSAQPPGA